LAGGQDFVDGGHRGEAMVAVDHGAVHDSSLLLAIQLPTN
jgi:hypothetical protein